MARLSMRDSLRNITAIGPRIIDNNTFRYERPDGTQVVRLHHTDIVETLPDGRIKLNSGGWKTNTTKDRMNDHAKGYSIYSKKGTWYVRRYEDSAEVPYTDGMLLPDALSGRALAKAEKEAARAIKLKADIKKFVAKTLPTGKPIAPPNNGDCWECLMFDRVEPVGPAKYLGGASEQPSKPRTNAGHLLSHVNEGYMHGSLVVNAMRDNGLSDVGISMIAFSDRPDYVRVRRIVRRYLQKRLGLTY